MRVILGAECVAAVFAIVSRSGRSCAYSIQKTELQFALKDNTVTLLAVLYWCWKAVAFTKEHELGVSGSRVLGKIFYLQGGYGSRLEKTE